MIYISDETIDKLIKEDVPYIDLTTLIVGIGNEDGKITFTTRDKTVLSGIETVKRIFNRLDIQVISEIPSGSYVDKGVMFLEGIGKASNLHIAWKVSLNILEYCSGIATRTRQLVDEARKVNPNIQIVTTRKNFPGTKELAINAIIHGGGFPHRLGLSETILIFKQHINFIGGYDELARQMELIKAKAFEKKVIVEVDTVKDALKMAQCGVDALQFDKMPVDELAMGAKMIKQINPDIKLIAAGGVILNNAADYAGTGVDVLNTTWVYFGKPADISAKIEGVRK